MVVFHVLERWSSQRSKSLMNCSFLPACHIYLPPPLLLNIPFRSTSFQTLKLCYRFQVLPGSRVFWSRSFRNSYRTARHSDRPTDRPTRSYTPHVSSSSPLAASHVNVNQSCVCSAPDPVACTIEVQVDNSSPNAAQYPPSRNQGCQHFFTNNFQIQSEK